MSCAGAWRLQACNAWRQVLLIHCSSACEMDHDTVSCAGASRLQARHGVGQADILYSASADESSRPGSFQDRPGLPSSEFHHGAFILMFFVLNFIMV